MFKHLFTLIWNKKKQNLLMITEMLISFLVIFALSTLLVFYYSNYKKPLGIDYENVWTVSYSSPVKTNNMDSIAMFYETLKQTIKSLPQVKEISFTSGNIPFFQDTWQGGIKFNKKEIGQVNNYFIENTYKEVLGMKLVEGRWFDKSDAIAKDK